MQLAVFKYNFARALVHAVHPFINGLSSYRSSMERMFFLRVSTVCSQLSFYVNAAVMNKRNCKCPQSRLVAGVQCGSSTVVLSSLTHGTREVFGWNMSKVCSFFYLAGGALVAVSR